MNELEKKFKDAVEKHGPKIQAAYDKLIELSEKYGIPVGSHLPESFDQFRGYEAEPLEGEEWGDYVEGVKPRHIAKLPFVDREYWTSSTTECEFNN